MDEKTLSTLEYFKVLDRLAGYAAFSASEKLAQSLRPTTDLDIAHQRQALTSEARKLLSVNADISIGGARDIRPLVERAAFHGVLESVELLEIKNTFIVARTLARSFEKLTLEYPHLTEITGLLPPPAGIIEAIGKAISDRGEVLDSASSRLENIRRELKISHDRLMTRLQKLISDPKNLPMLQEALITQRNGRYVVPLRAEYKNKLRSIIHDQSSSGATLFVEPLATVELNNQLHELELAERDEERRILSELSWLVGQNAEWSAQIIDALARLDLAFMCAKYSEDLHAVEPVIKPITADKKTNHPGTTIRLFQARHPLLDQEKVVPIDIVFDEHTFALVITGPNTGGKTVSLKTVGLIALMAQSGLHIPARSGSEISLFKNIFADIGDEQSIEQSLSTFSGHITNITRIFRRANQQTLVLLDELGSGTDPQEGSALARALLAYLVQKQIPCLVATHYPELKEYAHTTPGVVNASMEFDLKSLQPTYHLTIGLPGRSNALSIAKRLGLFPEIIDHARSMLDPDELHSEDLLDEIHRQRDLARKSLSIADKSRFQVEKLQKELTQRLDKIEDERLKILEDARQEVDAKTAELETELVTLRKALSRARQPLDALKPLEKEFNQLEIKFKTPVERTFSDPDEMQTLRLGEKIFIRSLNSTGIISAVAEDDIEVQLGNLRVRVRRSDIQRPGEEETSEEPATPTKRSRVRKALETPTQLPSTHQIFMPSPGMELDIRGQRAEDALDILDRYVESAFLAGLPFVRIIHGKGTGRLRQIVHEALSASPHVASYALGQQNEGGEGVTVAKLHAD